ncbi:MAG TPA: DUF1648 domain-containing protein [Spirochaetota bacterium]|nr:DUF1648 domain-containing protein [Spirochaetota bacterium]
MRTNRIAVIAHVVNSMLLVAIFAFSVCVFDQLPNRVPVHYNFAGVPDRWTDTSMLGWLTVPLLFAGITALFYGIALTLPWFRKRPQWINMPEESKKRFLALDEEARGAALRGMAAYLYWFPVSSSLMFLWMRYEEYRFIVLREPSFNGAWAIGIIIAGLAITTIAMLRGIKRLV